MSDEPTNGELGRRLDTITGLITGLISRPEYQADQRATERRFSENERNIDDLRRWFTDEIQKVHERISEQARNGIDSRRHWRELIYTGLIPAAVAVIAIIVQWILLGGKH